MICIYKILSPDLKECYVGSTTDFEDRKRKHKKKSNKCYSRILFEKYGFDNCKFVVLEQCTKEELKVKEQWWMDHSVRLVNNKDAFTTEEKTKEYLKKWYVDNKERVKELNKKWREANKEVIAIRQKAYYERKKQEIKPNV